MTEAEMVKDCYNKLSNYKESNIKEIVLEVPFLSRCIDMVIVDKEDVITSIEFKLSNWKKAIEQAKDHQLGVDKAYICLPYTNKNIPSELEQELMNNGLGLLIYCKEKNYPFEEIIQPKTINDRWFPRIVSLKRLINKISGNHVFTL